MKHAVPTHTCRWRAVVLIRNQGKETNYKWVIEISFLSRFLRKHMHFFDSICAGWVGTSGEWVLTGK